MKNMDELRVLIDTRYAVQKNRIGFENRLTAIEQGRDTADKKTIERYKRWYHLFSDLEETVDGEIKSVSDTLPIIADMSEVKGVNAVTAAKVASMIDIDRAKTISALWRYAGYGVVNDKAERPTKGEKLHYNKRLKTSCYVVGASLMRWHEGYREIYDNSKEYYINNRKDWTKLHRHYAAFRKMMKVWLAHLWLHWREIEGLPVRDPYAIAKLGHTTIIDKEKFGWPTNGKV
jgi:hypothetical protein